MADPRNVAHDKKVHEEKKHHHEADTPDTVHVPQPGKKPALAKEETPVDVQPPQGPGHVHDPKPAE